MLKPILSITLAVLCILQTNLVHAANFEAVEDLADVEFKTILVKSYSGIVADGKGERTSRPIQGNLLKIIAPNCPALGNFKGLTPRQISPDGRFDRILKIDQIQNNSTGNDVELVFRVNYGIATEINLIGVNTYFGGNCAVTYQQGNSLGDGECGKKFDCELETNKTTECVAEKFGNQSQGFSVKPLQAENDCVVAAKLKQKICAAREYPENYIFYCR